MAAKDYSEVLVKVGPTLRDADGGTLLVLDASLSQTHAYSARVSEHPVEQGADVADHVQPLPARLTINGVIATYPLGGGGSLEYVPGGWEVLRQALQFGQPVTVITSLATYENMVLTSISANRDAGGSSNLFPVIELQQVRIIASRTTTIPPEIVKAKAQKPKAPATQDAGRQPTAAPDPAQAAAVDRSLLKLAVQLFTGGSGG